MIGIEPKSAQNGGYGAPSHDISITFCDDMPAPEQVRRAASEPIAAGACGIWQADARRLH